MDPLNRRRFCARLLCGALAAASGCGALARDRRGDDGAGASQSRTPDSGSTRTSGSTPTDAAADPTSLAETGIPSEICDTEIVEGFSIREITDPAFAADWTGHEINPRYTRPVADPEEPGLPDSAVVVGREVEGRARAYPVSVLWFHEIVNDTFGAPLIVTYCSICRTGVVAERRVNGEPTRFGVSGQLWKPPDRYISASAEAGRAFGADRWNVSDVPQVLNGANLVMYDEATRSYWSQALAEAICGPRTGTRLPILPSRLASWGDWRETYPDTEILLPPPHSSVDLA